MTLSLFLDPSEAINTYWTNVQAPVPNWLLRRSEISDGAKLLYGRLLQYQGVNGLCKPFISTLTVELGHKSERTIQRLISELRDARLIRVKDRRDLSTSNEYEILAHPWWQEAVQTYVVQNPEIVKKRPDLLSGLTNPSRQKCREGASRQICREAPVTDVTTLPTNLTGLSVKRIREENQGRESPDSQASPALADSPTRGEVHAEGVESADTKGEEVPRDVVPFPTCMEKPEPLQTTELEDEDPEVRKARALRDARRAKLAADVQRDKKLDRLGKAELAKLKKLEKRKQEQEQGLEPLEAAPTVPWVYLNKRWREEFAKAFPKISLASRWVGKEIGQAKLLLELYDLDRVESAIVYLLHNWNAINTKFFKGVGGPVPGLGVLVSCHSTLVSTATIWMKYKPVLDKYNAYDPDPYAERPSELEAEWLVARKELKALGI